MVCAYPGLALSLQARRARFGAALLCNVVYKNRTIPLSPSLPTLPSLLSSRSHFDSLLPGPRNPQSASPRSQSRPYFPAASFPCPLTHLVQSSSLSTTTAPLDPSTDGTNSSNGSAGRRCSVTGERRPRESPHLPMTFKTRGVRISPILCPRGTPPLLSIRALRLILIIAARVCPMAKRPLDPETGCHRVRLQRCAQSAWP